MEQLTFQEFLIKTNKKPNDIKEETGLSLSMISRLKKGEIKLTSKTISIFKNIYNIELLESNQEDEKNKEIERLKEEIKKKNEEITILNQKIERKDNYIEIERRKKEIVSLFENLNIHQFSEDFCEKVKKLVYKNVKF